MKAIEKAIQAIGGDDKAAKAMDVHVSFIQQIRSGIRPVPPTRCKQISELSGVVTKHDLRPDVFDEDSKNPTAA